MRLEGALVAITREELGRRIGALRQRRGWSQMQLADALEVAQSAVSRIEGGERSVDSIELARIADVLRVSVLDLLADEESVDELGIAARVDEQRSPAALDVALARVRELLRFDRLLDDLGVPGSGRVAPPVPSWLAARPSKEQGKKLAQWLRKELGLGDGPITDLPDLVEDELGLDVALEPLPDGLAGLCVVNDRACIALVDSSAVVGRQRFTLAHEIAHLLAGDPEPVLVDEQLFSRSPVEVQANSFAAHFLMPEAGLKRAIKDRKVDGRVAAELLYEFGVSMDALAWQLLNVGWIKEGRRRSLQGTPPKVLAFQHGYVSQWQAGEQQRNNVRPPLRLVRRGFDAYRKGLIGVEPLANLFRMDDADWLRRELEAVGVAPEDWVEDTADI
jgi:Zn-dependent peptidase ImmA (M78 family)/transcriptional regulator with XRE-family HTH domain